jgi:hypothetical protein
MAEVIPIVELDPVYRKTITWRTDRNDLVRHSVESDLSTVAANATGP